jgi:two-component system, chemotaxis family, protein-glutamate methylesterase/glutaminase
LALLARDTNVENGAAPRAGLSALKQCGGITAVQDPNDAAIPEMPTTTLTRLEPDHVVGLAGMPGVETLAAIYG